MDGGSLEDSAGEGAARRLRKRDLIRICFFSKCGNAHRVGDAGADSRKVPPGTDA